MRTIFVFFCSFLIQLFLLYRIIEDSLKSLWEHSVVVPHNVSSNWCDALNILHCMNGLVSIDHGTDLHKLAQQALFQVSQVAFKADFLEYEFLFIVVRIPKNYKKHLNHLAVYFFNLNQKLMLFFFIRKKNIFGFAVTVTPNKDFKNILI